jgi:hypothetical protein
LHLRCCLDATCWQRTRRGYERDAREDLDAVASVKGRGRLSHQLSAPIPTFAQDFNCPLQQPQRTSRLHVARTDFHNARLREQQGVGKENPWTRGNEPNLPKSGLSRSRFLGNLPKTPIDLNGSMSAKARVRNN